MFYDTSILSIPLISFNGSLWDVLLRCSKWLLGAWLDSFTMILRCWLVVESNEPAPCLYDTVIQSYVQLKSGFQVNGQLWDALAPRGAVLPHCVVCSYRAVSLFKCGKFHISTKSTLELWVCEFWLLRCSTMVARAWPVCVEVIQDWPACCPESNEPTLMFLWLLSEISFDLFQWKSMGSVAKCSKWC